MTAVTRRAARRRTPLLVMVAAASLLGAGVAFGFWSAAGAGTGAASTGAPTAVSLSPGTPTASLRPGGQASVVLTITNPNSGGVRVGSLVLDTSQGSGGFDVDGAHAACGVTSLSYAAQNNGGSGWTLAGGQVLAVTLTDALSMATSAANACQGASFTVYLRTTP